ncbi:MAG TPA: chemotaxis protein CheW, partial [Ktedonobacteraceae bacterium]
MDDDTQSSYDDQELSSEDLEILRLFEEKSDWSSEKSDPAPSQDVVSPSPSIGVEEGSQDWLHATFIPEVTEDIARMQRSLARLEQETQVQPPQFASFKRIGHKVRGAAGMVECQGMATIAQYIEETSGQIVNGVIAPQPALAVYAQAIAALEMGIQNLGRAGTEGQLPLIELSGLFLRLPSAAATSSQRAVPGEYSPLREESPVRTSSRSKLVPYIRVDERRVDQLIQYSEQTASLQASVESAQEQFQAALQELRAAQMRLRHIQPQLSSVLGSEHRTSAVRDQFSSSLVARILNRSFPSSSFGVRGEGGVRNKSGRNYSDAAQWDELNMEQYDEKDMLVRSLTEAIADITVASTRVDEASTRLIEWQQEYINHVHNFRSKALLLRLAPLKALVSRLQHAISTSGLAHAQQIAFEVSGEEIEVDQAILDSLTSPLVQLMRTCITDVTDASEEGRHQFRVWLNASYTGNEITLELGFSMPVQGGALESIRDSLRSLNGTYSLRRNAAGGVSFVLCFPRSRGVTHFLTVRVSSQYLLVPFYQVSRITEKLPSSTVYHLGDLLGFPHQAAGDVRVQPILMLLQQTAEDHSIGVMVDEVVGEAEFEVKTLEPHLQRPGISGAVIDGHGNAILVVDLPDLVRHHALQPYTVTQHETTTSPAKNAGSNTILVADDSVSLRRSLCRMLRSEQYTVIEARDGLEALELLQKHLPA